MNRVYYNARESGGRIRHSREDTYRRRARKVRNSIQRSQVQKRQQGKKGSFPSCLVSVEPLEKATLDAPLFAVLVPAKTAVCHRRDRKEGSVLLPRLPGGQAPGTQELGRFAGNQPSQLAASVSVCKPTGRHTFLLGRGRRVCGVPNPHASRSAFGLKQQSL